MQPVVRGGAGRQAELECILYARAPQDATRSTDATLDELTAAIGRVRGGRGLPVYWNHQAQLGAIGSVTAISVNAGTRNVLVRMRISDGSGTLAPDPIAAISSGTVTHVSLGHDLDEATNLRTGAKWREGITIREVSLVAPGDLPGRADTCVVTMNVTAKCGGDGPVATPLTMAGAPMPIVTKRWLPPVAAPMESPAIVPPPLPAAAAASTPIAPVAGVPIVNPPGPPVAAPVSSTSSVIAPSIPAPGTATAASGAPPVPATTGDDIEALRSAAFDKMESDLLAARTELAARARAANDAMQVRGGGGGWRGRGGGVAG